MQLICYNLLNYNIMEFTIMYYFNFQNSKIILTVMTNKKEAEKKAIYEVFTMCQAMG